VAVLQFPKHGRTAGRSWDLGGARSRAVEIGGNEAMQDILESVKIDLDEDEIRRLIDAVDHYEAYLHSQQRDDTKFRELVVRLRKMLGKRP
jgi:hypothetical protein